MRVRGRYVSAVRPLSNDGLGVKGLASRELARERRRMWPALWRVLWYFGGGLPREAMKREVMAGEATPAWPESPVEWCY